MSHLLHLVCFVFIVDQSPFSHCCAMCIFTILYNIVYIILYTLLAYLVFRIIFSRHFGATQTIRDLLVLLVCLCCVLYSLCLCMCVYNAYNYAADGFYWTCFSLSLALLLSLHLELTRTTLASTILCKWYKREASKTTIKRQNQRRFIIKLQQQRHHQSQMQRTELISCIYCALQRWALFV